MPVYTYTTFDEPSGTNTRAYDINDSGQITGFFGNASGNHGFVYSGGSYASLSDPSAPNDTEAFGINANELIVGDYAGASHAFVFNPHIATFTTLDDPSATGGTTAYGINDSGLIVGTYRTGGGAHHGFLYFPNNGGTYVTLDHPLAVNGTAVGTDVYGINNSGQLVGTYYDANLKPHGFALFDFLAGYTAIDDPLGTEGTFATGITTRARSSGITKTAAAPTASSTAAASTPRSTIPRAWVRPLSMTSTTMARSSGLTTIAAAISTASSKPPHRIRLPPPAPPPI
jgi:probable HAF family extracellular repeat protein